MKEKVSAENRVRKIRRRTRKKYSLEGKVRIPGTRETGQVHGPQIREQKRMVWSRATARLWARSAASNRSL